MIGKATAVATVALLATAGAALASGNSIKIQGPTSLKAEQKYSLTITGNSVHPNRVTLWEQTPLWASSLPSTSIRVHMLIVDPDHGQPGNNRLHDSIGNGVVAHTSARFLLLRSFAMFTIVLAIGLDGCGGSTTSRSSSVPTSTTAGSVTQTTRPGVTQAPARSAPDAAGAFRARVNRICRAAGSFIVSLPRESTPQAFAYDTRSVLAVAPRWAAELAAVKAPSGDASRYAQLLRINTMQDELLGEELIDASHGAPVRAVDKIAARLQALATQYNKISDELGLRTCASNAIPSSPRKPPAPY